MAAGCCPVAPAPPQGACCLPCNQLAVANPLHVYWHRCLGASVAASCLLSTCPPAAAGRLHANAFRGLHVRPLPGNYAVEPPQSAPRPHSHSEGRGKRCQLSPSALSCCWQVPPEARGGRRWLCQHAPVSSLGMAGCSSVAFGARCSDPRAFPCRPGRYAAASPAAAIVNPFAPKRPIERAFLSSILLAFAGTVIGGRCNARLAAPAASCYLPAAHRPAMSCMLACPPALTMCLQLLQVWGALVLPSPPAPQTRCPSRCGGGQPS